MLEMKLGGEQVPDDVTLQAGREDHWSRARTHLVGCNNHTVKHVNGRLIGTVCKLCINCYILLRRQSGEREI